jgi:hypothetical protein
MRTRARRVLGAILIRFACLPPDAAGWLLVLLAHVLWGQRGSFGLRNGILVTELRRDAWPARIWFNGWAGIAIGHAVLFGAGRSRERNWKHERVRIDQCEAMQCAAAIAALLVFAICHVTIAAILVWSLGHAFAVLGGCAAAWLRCGNAYFDSVHVRAAYALEGCDDDDTRRSRRPRPAAHRS